MYQVSLRELNLRGIIRGSHVNRFLSFLSVLWGTENAKMAKTVETANREKRQFGSFISVFGWVVRRD